MFDISSSPIDPHVVIDSVRVDSSIGATISFIGSLRSQTLDGRPLKYAECAGDRQEAVQLLHRIGEEIRAKWKLEAASICHRVGRIEVGEVIMVVAVAARHRQDAFEACQYAVDRAKGNLTLSEIV